MMKRVLLTGANGFIGSSTIMPLLMCGYEVHTTTRKKSKIIRSDVFVHEVDLLNHSKHNELINYIKPTHLLHCAWYVEHGKYWLSAENARWLSASLSLIEEFCAIGGRRIVGVGTCAEYNWNDQILEEDVTPTCPSTLYGLSKLATGVAGSAIAKEFGVEFSWGRLFNPYGPGESSYRLIPYVILSMLNHQTARCTMGSQLRDFIHVSDVGRALVCMLESNIIGNVNIGSGVPASVRDVALLISRLMNFSANIEFDKFEANYDVSASVVGCMQRLTQEIGWRPNYSLEAGLVDAINWWKYQVNIR